jgi:hypothetical protein
VLLEYVGVNDPLCPSDVEYDAVHGVCADPVYVCGVDGHVTVTLDVALLIVKVALLLLPLWLPSPA